MKTFQLSPQQQQAFAQRFNNEMERMIMSWDNELTEWYPTAMNALKFANVRVMNIPQKNFKDLLKKETTGLGMNVVMALCNNIEDRSADEMGVDLATWGDILFLNHKIAARWQTLSLPIQNKIAKEFEIMANRPPMAKIIGNA